VEQPTTVTPTPGAIHVLATSIEGARVALETAIPLARGSQSRLIVIVTKVVPFASAPEGSVEAHDFTMRQYRNLVNDLDADAQLRLCLCRRPQDVIGRLLPRRATVVVGGSSGGILPSPEMMLTRSMAKLGHHVVFVPTSERGSGVLRFLFSLLSTALVCAVFASPQTLAAQPQAGANPPWQLAAFVDVGVLGDLNHPSNHLFRNRGTTPRVDELALNMAGVAAKKVPSDVSRWGTELTIHAGRDSETFGFSATAPTLQGADALRYFGPTNVSYRAPVGQGLTIQGGIFNSLIGYDSLYAKDNFAYTRPWGADYTPYLMLGVSASHPLTSKLTATAAVVNGYFHLAHANDAPSLAFQGAYSATDTVTVKQTVLYGSHQSNTRLPYWRVLSDSIVERKNSRSTAAFEFQVGAELVDAPGDRSALWLAAQLPLHWALPRGWSATLRPEFCWDRDGRWIGAPQSVAAWTTTVEYRVPYHRTQSIVRLEHRYDHSRGAGGGFFDDGHVSRGAVGLTPAQHLLTVAALFSFDASPRD
jgi:hypothetical protein